MSRMNLGSAIAAAGGNPTHAQLVDDMLGQLLIVLIKRAGGEVKIPASEIDATGQDLLNFKIDDGVFHFYTSKKS